MQSAPRASAWGFGSVDHGHGRPNLLLNGPRPAGKPATPGARCTSRGDTADDENFKLAWALATVITLLSTTLQAQHPGAHAPARNKNRPLLKSQRPRLPLVKHKPRIMIH